MGSARTVHHCLIHNALEFIKHTRWILTSSLVNFARFFLGLAADLALDPTPFPACTLKAVLQEDEDRAEVDTMPHEVPQLQYLNSLAPVNSDTHLFCMHNC